jgi:hypothetical protein
LIQSTALKSHESFARVTKAYRTEMEYETLPTM